MLDLLKGQINVHISVAWKWEEKSDIATWFSYLAIYSCFYSSCKQMARRHDTVMTFPSIQKALRRAKIMMKSEYFNNNFYTIKVTYILMRSNKDVTKTLVSLSRLQALRLLNF